MAQRAFIPIQSRGRVGEWRVSQKSHPPGSNRPRRARDGEQCRQQTDNSALLARVRDDRCESAYQTLYAYYFPRLRIFFCARNVDELSAQDLAQDVMIRVWRKAEQFDVRRANASAWIFTIARNLLIDTVRRRKRHTFDPEDPYFVPQAPPSAEQSLVQRGDEATIAAVMKTMPADQERILRLVFMEGRKQNEIAEELSMPLNTVKSKIRRGVQVLRDSMEKN